MPRRNKQSRKQKKGANPASTALRYTGPLTGPQEQLVTLDLVQDVVITSSAGGVISNVLADWPTGSPDWSSISALYVEYRILAMTVEFTPLVTGATMPSTLYNVLYIVWDSTNAAGVPLTSYTQAANYPVKSARSLNVRSRMSHKMVGVEEATFALTSSAVIDYSFKLYADTLTASTTYGRVTTTWHSQFRGRA